MAKSIFRRATKTVFIAINVFISLLFLFGALSSHINPANWWMNGFTGLIVPYLVLILVFFVVFWLFAKPILTIIPLCTLFIGYQQLHVIFAWHPSAGFVKHKHDDDLRIADWNIQSFNGLSKNKAGKKPVRNEVAESIIKFHPDLICMQEFNHANTTDNISLFSKQYPYHYFSKDYLRANGNYQSGCIIFSKFPIIDSGKIQYPIAESLIFADIVKGADTFRIYTTHLQSFKFKKEDYNDLEKIKDQDDENLIASKSIFRKMDLAFNRRGVQTGLVREAIEKSPYPSVICGDFNDVPNSYTYFHIKGDDRQDAFLQKGFGIGRSFISLAPTLRIDYILPDSHFDIRQFQMVNEELSDHIMLLTDIHLKK